MAATDSSLPGLLTPSVAYKPFRYPWAYDFWKKQQQVHWMPEEVPLGEDCKDWAVKLSDAERNLLTQIFRFFTQSRRRGRRQLHGALHARVFKPVEVKMMLSAFSNIETDPHRGLCAAAGNHRHAGNANSPPSWNTRKWPRSTTIMQKFDVDSDEDILPSRMAMFGGVHGRAAAVRFVRDADELPAPQQDEAAWARSFRGRVRDESRCTARA
jgi:ribonucleoside-diphosphate reductase beta chain